MLIATNVQNIEDFLQEKYYYEASAMLVNEGSCRLKINGKTVKFLRNNLFLRLPNTVVELEHQSKEINISIFSISATTFDNAIYNIPSYFLQSLSENSTINLIHYTRKIRYLFRGLEVTNVEANLFRNEIILNLLRNFYMEVANIVLSQQNSVDMGTLKHSRRLCDKFISMVRDTPGQHSVAYFADKLCITPKYLSQLTHQHIGTSAKAFINRCMIGEIKMRLSSMDLTLEELSLQMNFSSVSSLCRFFKQETGESMKRFRGGR